MPAGLVAATMRRRLSYASLKRPTAKVTTHGGLPRRGGGRSRAEPCTSNAFTAALMQDVSRPSEVLASGHTGSLHAHALERLECTHGWPRTFLGSSRDLCQVSAAVRLFPPGKGRTGPRPVLLVLMIGFVGLCRHRCGRGHAHVRTCTRWWGQPLILRRSLALIRRAAEGAPRWWGQAFR
jgi:hypothetical protein